MPSRWTPDLTRLPGLVEVAPTPEFACIVRCSRKAQVVRTGLAVEFGLSVVRLDGRRDVLTGVFTLAVARMDEPVVHQQSWLDLGETIDQVGPLLEERSLSLG